MLNRREVNALQKLDENILKEIYIKSTLVHNMDPSFIQLLEEEILRRRLEVTSEHP